MIRHGFLDERARDELTRLARTGAIAHHLARRANALILLDRGPSCTAVAEVLLLDDDTIWTWHKSYEQTGIQSLAEFGYRGRARRSRIACEPGSRPSSASSMIVARA